MMQSPFLLPGLEIDGAYRGHSNPVPHGTLPRWGPLTQPRFPVATSSNQPMSVTSQVLREGHSVDRVMQCRYCDATFTAHLDLLGHTNSVHLNRQQFVCSLCGKGFAQKQFYQDHINMHNQVKAHSCQHCSVSFTYKRNLWRHLRYGVCRKDAPGTSE